MLACAAGMARAEAIGPLVPVSGASPFAACRLDESDAQPGANFLGTEVEPRLAINPTNRSNLVATFQQDRWSNGGSRGLMVSVSFDGGGSWREVVIPGTSRCSGGRYDRVSDPWISFAPNGDLYHVSLALGVDAQEPREPHGVLTPALPDLPAGENAMLVSKSTDGGLSWGEPITLIHDEAGPLNDKQSVTADPTDLSSKRVFVVWDRLNNDSRNFHGPAMFARTTNGGVSWEPARPIYDPGRNLSTVGNQILVRPDGTVYDFFTEFTFVGPALSFVRSTDHGQTWGGVTRALTISAPGVSDPELPRPIRTGGSLVDVTVDPQTGALYATWQQFLLRVNGRSLGAVVLAYSDDGGAHWFKRFVSRISASPTLNDQAFTPTVRVNARGVVGVAFYDFRENDGAPGVPTDFRLVSCYRKKSGGCSLNDETLRETRLTDVPFDIERAPYAYGLFVGDYQGLEADGDDFLALFSQPHGVDRASVFFRRVRPWP